MKIKIFGWKCPPLDVVSRVEEGLINNGAIICNDGEVDLLYKNEDFYDEAIDFLKKTTKKPFVIFNILDLQVNNPNYNLYKIKEQLQYSDVVTCISDSVKNQIKKHLNIEAQVIYNPIKDVSYKGIDKKISFLYVGRANDQNKRFRLAAEALHMKNWSKGLVVCGSENPMFGNYAGIVSDADLNEFYNISKFTLLPSKFEGIGLPMIEAMICGSIPITCKDNPTALEFSPEHFICDPNPTAIIEKIQELNQNYDYFQKIALQYGEKYLSMMNKNKVAKNIIDIYNKSKCR